MSEANQFWRFGFPRCRRYRLRGAQNRGKSWSFDTQITLVPAFASRELAPRKKSWGRWGSQILRRAWGGETSVSESRDAACFLSCIPKSLDWLRVSGIEISFHDSAQFLHEQKLSHARRFDLLAVAVAVSAAKVLDAFPPSEGCDALLAVVGRYSLSPRATYSRYSLICTSYLS